MPVMIVWLIQKILFVCKDNNSKYPEKCHIWIIFLTILLVQDHYSSSWIVLLIKVCRNLSQGF